MSKALFIDNSYLLSNTALNGSVDQDLIRPILIMQQDKQILPFLGTDLYNKLKSDIIGGTVSGVYQTLLEDYIQPALAQFAFEAIIPFVRVRIVNSGVQVMSSEQSSPATESDVKPIRDMARQMGEFYRERMIDYLIHNTSSFPEYSSNTGADLSPIRTNYTGGMNLEPTYALKRLEQRLRDAGLDY